MVRFTGRWKIVAFAALAQTVLAWSAESAEAQNTFKASHIDIIVPFAVGGATDSYGRFLAKVLNKHLPSRPSVILRNIPGAGSITGTTYFQKNARQDGTMLLVVSPTPLLTQILAPEGREVGFNPSHWLAVVGSAQGRVIYSRSNTKLRRVEDIRTYGDTDFHMGLTSATGSDMITLLSLDLLGVRVKPVLGYDGGNLIRLAFERNELDIGWENTQTFLATGKKLVEGGTAIPLFSFGLINGDGEYIRDPHFPDIPSFVEAYRIVHGKEPKGPAFEAWEALFKAAVVGSKALVLPAGTKPELVETFREAILTAMEERSFQAEYKLLLGDYTPYTGKQATENIKKSTNISRDAQMWLREWLKQKFNAAL